MEDDKFMIQTIARGLLGVINSLAMIYFKKAIDWTCVYIGNEDKIGKKNAYLPSYAVNWFWAFTVVQFHVPFYLSRTLPNFMAFPITTMALAYILEASYESGLGFLAFAAIVYRGELAILLATLSLSLLVFGKLSVPKIAKAVAIGAVVGGALSLAVDSYFWQTPLMLPELKGFLFNVVDGKSSEWGVEPLDSYFTIHLPKLLGSVARPPGWFILFGLVPFGFFKDPTGRFNHLRILGLASVLYVAIYSLQPHKEWRFIIYVVPVFTLLAANAVVYISNELKKRGELLKTAFQMAVVTLIAVIGGLSLVKVLASSFNYPGGQALSQFHNHVPLLASPNGDPLVVHMDVPVCMSGATRFGQLYSKKTTTGPWVIYDKTEDPEELEELADSFDYLITVLPPANVSSVFPPPEDMSWSLLETVQSYDQIDRVELRKLIYEIKDDSSVFVEKFREGDDSFFAGQAFRVVTLKDSVYIYQRTQNYPWTDI